MKKIIFSILALSFMAACVFPSGKNVKTENIQQALPEDPALTSTKAITFQEKEYALSKKPDLALQSGFQKILDVAYSKTLEENADADPKETGFIYSMRPTGAINPFAEVKVSCIIQERYQKKGQELCGTFFNVLNQEYQYLLHPETRPKEGPAEENKEAAKK